MRRIRIFAPITASAIAAALLLAGIAMALYAERSYRARKIDEMAVQAQILASTVTAALTFRDRATAQEYVDALMADPAIRAVALYDAGGSLFVSYTRGEARVPDTAPTGEPRIENDRIIVVAPVAENDTVLGSVYLRALIEPLHQRLLRYGGIAMLAAMASLVVLVLAIAQAQLRRANTALQDRAVDLAAANRELHAQIEERKKAEAALRQAQKMETIGQLTGGVAHDFNNLLTIIMGNLERLHRRLGEGGDPALKQAVDNAMRGAERAATLTRSLLAFSRRQPLDPKPVDVNRLVANMSDLLHRSIGERITVETVVASGLWQTHADPNQLENAILNLAVNARDAMPDGGKLTIETANAHLDANYAAAQAEVDPGQYVVISITDTGSGMTREVMEQVFEPFFTTKDVGHGTGLGLSQVYGFVNQSGGHVKIYSEPGEGTTVKIYLPRFAGEKAFDEIAQSSPNSPAEHRAETVLVVEDDEGVRGHSVAILRELGYRVFEAASAKAALEILDTQPEIALLFTDVGLPGGFNGRQLANEATRRRPDLEVLFTTGYARNAIGHDGKLDPGVHLVTKPFTYAEVAAAVRERLNARSGPPCILVVEDDLLVRMTAVQALKDLGCRIIEASTAREGIESARAAEGEIDAAVVDIGLPDQRGDTLAVELRSIYPDMPIIMATGYAEDEIRERFSSDPLVHFLGKPYDYRALAAVLKAAGTRLPRSPGRR